MLLLNHDIAKVHLLSIQSNNLFFHKFLVRPATTRWQKVEVIAEKTSERIILWDLKVSDKSSISKNINKADKKAFQSSEQVRTGPYGRGGGGGPHVGGGVGPGPGGGSPNKQV